MVLKKYRICVFGILLFFACGCSFLPWKNPDLRFDEADGKAKIIDSERLKAGGSLVVIPFRAGSGVAQTDSLEKVALTFVKGFAEAMGERKGPLRVVSPDEMANADFIFKGHVVSLTQTKGALRWRSKAKDLQLALDGEIVDQKTGHTVFTFSDKRKVTSESPDHRALALDMGRDTAATILGLFNE